MKNRRLASAALIAFFTTSALAQHSDVRPYVEDGKIHTAGFVDATSTELPDVRVFGYDFGEDPEQPYFTQDPGFNAATGSGLPAASQLLFNIVGGGGLGLPANLSYWDGIGAVEFSVTPAGETLTLNFGSQNRIADDATDFVAGFNLQTVSTGGAIHRHLNAFLNGSGGDPTAGIYLLPVELQSGDASIEKSLPFYLLYNNGLDEEAHDVAIDWVERNLVVPEPSTLLATGIASVIGCLSMRRRTNSISFHSNWRTAQRLPINQISRRSAPAASGWPALGTGRDGSSAPPVTSVRGDHHGGARLPLSAHAEHAAAGSG